MTQTGTPVPTHRLDRLTHSIVQIEHLPDALFLMDFYYSTYVLELFAS